MADEVVVVGAGVTGLTTAVCLAEAGFAVRVLADEDPADTTSAAAGAIWGPYEVGPADLVAHWGVHTLRMLRELAEAPELTGVRLRSGIEVARSPVPVPPWSRHLDDFVDCPEERLPAGFAVGWTFSAPVVDMPVYLGYLLDRLRRSGGRLARTRVSDLGALDPAPPLVVNCAGAGAAALVEDPALSPSRGQVVVVDNPGIEEFFVEERGADRDQLYILPHGATAVLGATFEPGRSDRAVDPVDTSDIRARASAVYPALAGARVRSVRVGIRPARAEVRLEIERVAAYPVLHNYGHGGAGVSLSWGCARRVTELAGDLSVFGGPAAAPR